MGLLDDAAQATRFQEDVDRLQKLLNAERDKNAELERVIGRVTQLKPADRKIPTWVSPKRKLLDRTATPVLMLSDLHFDEVVDKGEMDGLNAYDRAIAEQRLERTINKTVEYLKSYVSGVHLDGIVVGLLGDIITGAIHEELAKTNEAPVPATVVHWIPKLASALTYLADELGRVFVPTVDGNHDRTGKRIQFKQRTYESFAWIIYHWLADHLRDDDRITFSISQSPEQIIPIHNTRFLLHHGDISRSSSAGTGIGGIFPPIVRWVTKKQDTLSSVGRGFDYALLGHWHQEIWGPNFVINGSMKGYDEFARGMAFRYEPPKQCLFLVSPERGITQRSAIFCE